MNTIPDCSMLTINTVSSKHTISKYQSLVKAHQTVQNILEYVGKTAMVSHSILLQVIEQKYIVIEQKWPGVNEKHNSLMARDFEFKTKDEVSVLANDELFDVSTKFEFLEENNIKSWLVTPIRYVETSVTLTGLVSFASDNLQPWTAKQHVLLEMARDLILATLNYSSIFTNLDDNVVYSTAHGLEHRLSDEQHTVLKRIVDLFERLRRHSKIKDLWETHGVHMFTRKLANFILANQTILMVLPAFPFKNKNRNTKVIGILPDMGEVLALVNLNSFAHQVSEIYSPGCKILVVSDGRVFNDLYPVSDDIVSDYTKCIHSLGQDHLQFIGLDQLFSSATDNQFKRDAIVHLYGNNIDNVYTKLKDDEHFRQVYVSFKRLLRKDIGDKRSLVAEKAKTMMIRNESYSELIRILFPHHVRLSIHDHSNVEKIGVHLIGDSVITPWHGVPVKRKNGAWTIMRKEMALRLGCILEDAMIPSNRDNILDNDLNSLDILQNDFFSSLPFYREV